MPRKEVSRDDIVAALDKGEVQVTRWVTERGRTKLMVMLPGHTAATPKLRVWWLKKEEPSEEGNSSSQTQ